MKLKCDKRDEQMGHRMVHKHCVLLMLKLDMIPMQVLTVFFLFVGFRYGLLH